MELWVLSDGDNQFSLYINLGCTDRSGSSLFCASRRLSFQVHILYLAVTEFIFSNCLHVLVSDIFIIPKSLSCLGARTFDNVSLSSLNCIASRNYE